MPTATVVFRIGDYHHQLLERAGPSELEELLVRWAQVAAEHCPLELPLDLLEHVRELHADRYDDEDVTAALATCAAALTAQGEREEQIDYRKIDADPEWMVLSGVRVAVEVLAGERALNAEWVTWVGVCATVCADVADSFWEGTDMVHGMRLLWGIDWSVELHEVAFGLLPDWEGTIAALWSASSRLISPTGGRA